LRRTVPRATAVAAVIAAFALGAGACNSSSKSPVVAAPSVTASATTTATTGAPTDAASTSVEPTSASPTATLTPSTSPEPTTSSAAANGTNFGYVKTGNSSATPPTLTIDYAQLLTGPAADKAAQEDGVIGPGQHIENDYYIRNKNPKLRTFPISPSATVQLLPRNPDGSSSSETVAKDVPFFLSVYSASKPPGYDGDVTMLAYNITLHDGVVTAIAEVFFP
jgi:hypothetical protein